jgi:hypothetical protein
MATDLELTQVLERVTDRYYGKYRGIVSVNVDPLNMGRLTATVPEVLGDVPTTWALPVTPYAGPGSGFFAVPPVGAGVWIEFEAGDVSRPLWSGAWWGKSEVPKDEAGTQATFTTKMWRTDQGLLVALDDTRQTITLADQNGTNLLTLKVLEGTILAQSATRVVLEAPLIEHGANASHPCVLGDLLLSYLNQLVLLFNTHTHPGELALGAFPVTPSIAVPQFPPATASLVSTKVVTE